jgi:hypothetical protein
VSTTDPPSLHSSSIASDQFDDVAYSPVLLPNHGAGTGRGARLEILEATEPPLDTPPASHVDRPVHGMGSRAHAHWDSAPSPPPAAHVDPPMHGVGSRAHADDAPSTPRASSPGAGPSSQPLTPAALIRPRRIHNFCRSMLVL